MSRSKRRLCGALALLILLGGALAESVPGETPALLIDQPSATSSSIMAAKPATIPMVAKYGSASRFC